MLLEALLHYIDSIEMFVEGEGQADFHWHCSNHRR